MFEVVSSFLLENRWAISYGLAVLSLVMLTHCRNNVRQKSVSSAICLLWILNILYTEITKDRTPVIFFATGHFVFGMLILISAGKNKWQRGIGAWFILMTIVHISYWLYEPKMYGTQYMYWLSLTACAWGQLFHVGFWYFQTDWYGRTRSLSGNAGLSVEQVL